MSVSTGHCSRSTAERLLSKTKETLNQISESIQESGKEGAIAQGKLFELIGYFDRAITSYQEALSEDPGCPLARARLALAQIKGKRFEEALNTASEIAAKDPFFTVEALATDEKIPALTILGDALAVNQRFSDAIEAYSAVEKKAELDPYTSGRLAQMYLSTGNSEKALALRAKMDGSLRFADLQSVLSLGETSLALLPSYDAASLANAISQDVHGRPLMVEGEVKTAPSVMADTGWCAEID